MRRQRSVGALASASAKLGAKHNISVSPYHGVIGEAMTTAIERNMALEAISGVINARQCAISAGSGGISGGI